ncbi:MAG TPA: RbsD/FucU domain-containing protein [Caulobacteraceae bacterium]|nr:RbsD/FucU domain-containing protein [Caulobacteraceae bacterium]
MLKGIDPPPGPELLATLRAMGHADEIAVVDAKVPAAAYAIVATGERRYWGNLILKKGAIPPEGS